MKKIAIIFLALLLTLTLCFSTPVEAGTKKSNTKYSNTYKTNSIKKNSKNSYTKKGSTKSSGKSDYKKPYTKKSSKKASKEWPDCDDYWDEDEFLDDWDGNMPDGSDAMDYWDNW